MLNLRKNKIALIVVEYALLIAAVAAAFTAMIYYARRVVNGKLLTLQETINMSTDE